MGQQVTLTISEFAWQHAQQVASRANRSPEAVLVDWIEQQTPEVLTLYTIGHSDLSANEFLAALQQHRIQVLLDVRSAPYSKYAPQFNKRELEAFLKANAVDYRFAGEILGGRPGQADVYKNNEVPDKATKREDFLDLVQYTEIMRRDWYQKGIARLVDIIRETAAKGGGVAVMCSEGNPHECHRHHLIVRSLIDPRVKVNDAMIQAVHILKDRQLEAVDPSVFVDHPQQIRLF